MAGIKLNRDGIFINAIKKFKAELTKATQKIKAEVTIEAQKINARNQERVEYYKLQSEDLQSALIAEKAKNRKLKKSICVQCRMKLGE